jgi:nucleoside-triphosphatase THEP1
VKRINIVTGKIQSGKTTYIENKILELNNVAGIIQLSQNGERYFKNIPTGITTKITAQVESDKVFRIGRFLFYKEAFSWAKINLCLALSDKAETIVVDEFGPLEFNGKGLEPVITEIIEIVKKGNSQKLIIAIRETLVKDFLLKYGLTISEVEITKISRAF